MIFTRLSPQHCRISLKKPGVPTFSFQSFDKYNAELPSDSLVPLLQHSKQPPSSGPLHMRFPLPGMPFPQMGGLADSCISGLCSHGILAVRSYLTTVLKNCIPTPPTVFPSSLLYSLPRICHHQTNFMFDLFVSCLIPLPQTRI